MKILKIIVVVACCATIQGCLAAALGAGIYAGTQMETKKDTYYLDATGLSKEALVACASDSRCVLTNGQK